jgi:hypothetical protein
VLPGQLSASFVIVFLSRGAPWTCFEMETTTVILLWLSGLALSDESSWKYYTVNIEEKVLLTATVLPGQHCCVLVKIPVHYNSAFFFCGSQDLLYRMALSDRIGFFCGLARLG